MEDGRIQWIDGTVCAWGDAENMLLSFKFKNWKSLQRKMKFLFTLLMNGSMALGELL